MTAPERGTREGRFWAAVPAGLEVPVRAGVAAAIGLLVGVAFTLPVFAYLRTGPGNRRTALVVLAAVVAMLVIRRAGRLLRGLLDATAQPWRLPLLGLYGLAAMALPASLVLLQPGAVAGPVSGTSQPASR